MHDGIFFREGMAMTVFLKLAFPDDGIFFRKVCGMNFWYEELQTLHIMRGAVFIGYSLSVTAFFRMTVFFNPIGFLWIHVSWGRYFQFHDFGSSAAQLSAANFKFRSLTPIFTLL